MGRCCCLSRSTPHLRARAVQMLRIARTTEAMVGNVPTPVLRYSIRRWCAWTRRDDRLLQRQGLEGLSAEDVRIACEARGLAPTTWRRHLLAVAAPRPLRAIDYVVESRRGSGAVERVVEAGGAEGPGEAGRVGEVPTDELRSRLDAWVMLSVDCELAISLVALAAPPQWWEAATPE